MAKHLLIYSAALLFLSPLTLAGQTDTEHSRLWSGPLINGTCSPEEAFGESPKCTEGGPDTKLSLYDDTTRQIFELDSPDQVPGHLGDQVTVTGTLVGNTIHVASVRLLTSIGLPVGYRAPALSARDQFGQVQTLDTLKGPHGTVLLFFRSADW